MARSTSKPKSSPPRFESILWQAADKMRGNLDAAEYKHVVLGIIFLKYVSDAFEERHRFLVEAVADPKSDYFAKDPIDRERVPEDRDEYVSENIFWVPKEARWSYLLGRAKQPTIGKDIDDAMVAIERDNPSLKGVLPKDYARPHLDKQRLGELIDLIGNIGLGDKESRSKDILGQVYEYFLSRFASAEGKKGGQFYTPRPVVRLLVEMLAPYKGRVFDPCCGSGGMFVLSEKFVEAHGGRVGDVSIFGQESNPTTWRLAKMNLAIRGIVRWKFGPPPVSNANFAWVQHFIHHLSPTGLAGFVLANGSMSSNQSGESERYSNPSDWTVGWSIAPVTGKPWSRW